MKIQVSNKNMSLMLDKEVKRNIFYIFLKFSIIILAAGVAEIFLKKLLKIKFYIN